MGVRYQRAADLVELMGILQTTSSGLSIDEIAQRFDVSRRTAERMLAALRDRIPDLEPNLRAGRKYWLLPRSARTRPIQLPKTLEALSQRVLELEMELERSRMQETTSLEIGELLGTSRTGLLVLDAAFRVLWANESLLRFFGLNRGEILSHDMRTIVREKLRDRLEDGEAFEQRVLATYASNGSFDHGECHVLPAPGRDERWLEHGSHPIAAGRHAGGRIDHFFELTQAGAGRSRASGPQSSSNRAPGPLESAAPVLRMHLATIRAAAEEALAVEDLSPAAARRLVDVFQSSVQTIGDALGSVERGQAKIEGVNVAMALQTVAALNRASAEARGIALVVNVSSDLPRIAVDPTIFISTMSAGTRNSIDSLPRGSRIELSAELLEDPARVRISLRDDFPTSSAGFPEINSTFVPTRSGGVGLGLTLARDEQGRPTGGITQYCEAAIYSPPDAPRG